MWWRGGKKWKAAEGEEVGCWCVGQCVHGGCRRGAWDGEDGGASGGSFEKAFLMVIGIGLGKRNMDRWGWKKEGYCCRGIGNGNGRGERRGVVIYRQMKRAQVDVMEQKRKSIGYCYDFRNA